MEINLQVRSKAFENNGDIPIKYTAKGEEVSPPLEWDKVDEKVKSIAITMEDIDTPIGVITHWLLWNIPPTITEIPENIPHIKIIDSLGGAYQGRGIFGKLGYLGPNPPSGTHRYIFKVYGLDTLLDLNPSSNKKALLKAIEGHIIQYGLLEGKFTK